MAQVTIYASLAGGVRRYSGGSTFAGLHDGAGTDLVNGGFNPTIGTDASSNQYTQIARGFLVFDTSSLPDNATITAATLSIYITGSQNQLGGSINVYKGTLANAASIATGDYAGTVANTTAHCDTAKTYAGVSTSAYNDFALNASGLANISLTGNSIFGLRDVKDAANTAPTWQSSKQDFISYQIQSDANKPKLVITYSVPSTGAFVLNFV